MDIRSLRTEYPYRILMRSDLQNDPLSQFLIWLEEAIHSKEVEPNAFILSTASKDGVPSARTLLLKIIDEQGLVFFTNNKSRKASQIEENPFVAATFFWQSLHRQVLIQGIATKISSADTEEYFAMRPKESQIGAWASMQGEVIPNKEALTKRFDEVKKQFFEKSVPCPPFWSGYKIIPHSFEFWQGAPSRMHDRFLYKKTGIKWTIERLMP